MPRQHISRRLLLRQQMSRTLMPTSAQFAPIGKPCDKVPGFCDKQWKAHNMPLECRDKGLKLAMITAVSRQRPKTHVNHQNRSKWAQNFLFPFYLFLFLKVGCRSRKEKKGCSELRIACSESLQHFVGTKSKLSPEKWRKIITVLKHKETTV